MTNEKLDADDSPDLPADPAAGRLGGFAAGVVFGAFLGAGLALLFAPDRGDKTRSRLRRRLRHLREQAREGMDRAGSRTREDLIRRRRLIKAQLDRAAERARDAL
jgi:gas vesicle protein